MSETIEFVCLDRGEQKHLYGRPYATLQQDQGGGLTDLVLSGYPFCEKLRKGKRYRVTVEEVES